MDKFQFDEIINFISSKLENLDTEKGILQLVNTFNINSVNEVFNNFQNSYFDYNIRVQDNRRIFRTYTGIKEYRNSECFWKEIEKFNIHLPIKELIISKFNGLELGLNFKLKDKLKPIKIKCLDIIRQMERILFSQKHIDTSIFEFDYYSIETNEKSFNGCDLFLDLDYFFPKNIILNYKLLDKKYKTKDSEIDLGIFHKVLSFQYNQIDMLKNILDFLHYFIDYLIFYIEHEFNFTKAPFPIKFEIPELAEFPSLYFNNRSSYTLFNLVITNKDFYMTNNSFSYLYSRMKEEGKITKNFTMEKFIEYVWDLYKFKVSRIKTLNKIKSKEIEKIYDFLLTQNPEAHWYE